jgi:hypothetical protein
VKKKSPIFGTIFVLLVCLTLTQADALAATIIFFYPFILSEVPKRLTWALIIISLIALAFIGCRSGPVAFLIESIILFSSFLGLLLMFIFNPLSVVNLVELWWLLGV